MNVNSDPSIQVQEIFSNGNVKQINHLLLLFNQNLVISTSMQNHRGTCKYLRKGK